MARRRVVVLANSIDALVKARRALEAKERSLISNLNASLKSMGYEITPRNSGAGPGGFKRRRGSAGTRKPMSPNARKAVSRRMKAYWAERKAKPEPRRRGRSK
jgi:hypothetical protein